MDRQQAFRQREFVKPLLYLETTVVSYLTARPTRDLVMAARQQITVEWWGRRRADFRVSISQLVLAEASRGDEHAAARRLAAIHALPVLAITPDVAPVAESLQRTGLLPPNAGDDAIHIAIAAVHSAHFLLTWNFRHIANAEHSAEIQALVRSLGYNCPVICTPEELLGGTP